MKKNLLLVFASLAIAPLQGGLFAQGQMRGEEDFSATQRAVEMVKIAEEIEQAGFVLDVEEAFDDEGEEGAWISADADDIEVASFDQEDVDLLDMEDVSSLEEELDAEVNALDVAEEMEDAVVLDEDGFVIVDEMISDNEDAIEEMEMSSTDSDEVLFALNQEDEATEYEFGNWWEESGVDESWNEVMDEWELEALENSYEEEDMATLEAMYEKG